MANFGLQLPTIQNWSCQSCSGCCKQHGIFITPEEKQRIEDQNWTEADGIPADQPVFVKMGGGLRKTWWRLAHQPDGACVFLDKKGLCRIHGKFGEPAKPLACRIYPYAFHPAGKKVTVSLRFSCPTVVANGGRSILEQSKDVRSIARQVVPDNVTKAKPPEITPGQRLEWTDFHRFVDALDETFDQDDMPFLSRLLQAGMWIGLVEQSKFDSVLGDRLKEFLDIIVDAAQVEIPDSPEQIPEPSRVGRMQFRLLAGQYARKDTYASADGTLAGRMRLLRTALRLTKGQGSLPPIQDCFREVPFDRLEQPFGVPKEADEIFTRYFRVKIQGIAFCGPAFYRVPLVEGFYSMMLVYPAVLWIARWLAASNDRSTLTVDDVAQAMTIADHHHGYSPAFGTWGFRRRVRTLAQLGDIARLAAWYSR